MRDVQRKLDAVRHTDETEGEQLHGQFARLLGISGRIHSQKRIRAEGDAPKIYSVHAPEVSCIAKGNAHKQYEFGNKVSVASTSKESFVVGMKSLPGNPFDGHTLKAAIEQVTSLSGVTPKEA